MPSSSFLARQFSLPTHPSTHIHTYNHTFTHSLPPSLPPVLLLSQPLRTHLISLKRSRVQRCLDHMFPLVESRQPTQCAAGVLAPVRRKQARESRHKHDAFCATGTTVQGELFGFISAFNQAQLRNGSASNEKNFVRSSKNGTR